MLTDDVSTGGKIKVALRKESVDRNLSVSGVNNACRHVALRKESVDRNAIFSAYL